MKTKTRILIVEDDGLIATDTHQMLTAAGYEVSAVVASGEQAVQSAADNPPDLVLMDIKLPGALDGIAAAAQIRARRNIPIIYLTGYANGALIERAKVTVPFGYLLKPVQDTEVQVTIEMALSKHRMETALQETNQRLEQEISERKRVAEELRESEERYRTIVEQQLDAVCRWLPDTTLTFVNHGYCQLFGVTRAEMVGQSWLTLLPEQERETAARFYQALAHDPIVYAYERHVIRTDGRISWQHWIDSPIFDETGALVEFQSVGRDITERKQSEEELQHAYRELADIRQELIQSETLVALGGFASGVAHEIRNPLTNIQVSAQYCLNNYSLDKDLKKFLGVILRNAEKANRTILEMLDFAKPMQLSFQPGDLVQVIGKACDLTKARRAYQKIRLHKRCARRLPKILMDAHRLEQVFVNCIMNALDAMKHGGRLSITAFPEGKDVVITFADTGIGIRERDLEKIFTPFFTTKPKGVGLGLSLARRLIQLHHGTITLTSRVHEGTQVTIKFPILQE
jgi:PAS domain S-box-containing protein